MAGYLIAATGTECGKTLLTAGLLWQLREAGHKAQAIKPVISGFDPAALAESDTGILLAAMEREVSLEEAEKVSPWRYARPVSPHLASAGDASLSAKTITEFCTAALDASAITLVEGAGGIMSPLVQGFTQADLAQALGMPVVLVAGCYLGSISHTLTAVEALRARNIAIAAIVISDAPDSTEPAEEIRASIASHLPQPLPVFTLPRISPKTKPAWKHLPPLLEILSDGKAQ